MEADVTEKAVRITLRADISRSDLELLGRWTRDEEVVRYLNEERGISAVIGELSGRSDIPVLTPLFNREGSFYMLCLNGAAVGFSRLVPHEEGTEIVLAIGERALWGRGLGTSAIRTLLGEVFFARRCDSAVAYIHRRNLRSERAFCKNGFTLLSGGATHGRYVLRADDYLRRLGSRS